LHDAWSLGLQFPRLSSDISFSISLPHRLANPRFG